MNERNAQTSGPEKRKPRIIVVGNAREPDINHMMPRLQGEKLADFIDACDIVVRFNEIKNRDETWIGSRTDILVLNCLPQHKQTRYDHSLLSGFDTIWIIGDPHSDGIRDILTVQNWHHKEISRIHCPSIGQLLTWARERSGDPELLLSAGCIAIESLVTNPLYADWDKYIAGFTFTGWRGHDWTVERELCERHVAAGLLKIPHAE